MTEEDLNWLEDFWADLMAAGWSRPSDYVERASRLFDKYSKPVRCQKEGINRSGKKESES